MVEKPTFNPDSKEHIQELTATMLEAEMQEKRTELEAARARVAQLTEALDALQKSGNEAVIGTAWKAWKEAKNAYAKMVEAVSEYERERGARITVPDGSYRVEVNFMHRKRKEQITKTQRIFGEMQGATLKDIISNACGAISMLGVHSFGFYPEEQQDECRYTLQGPDDFAYHSSVLIDGGGQIIRRANDVR